MCSYSKLHILADYGMQSSSPKGRENHEANGKTNDENGEDVEEDSTRIAWMQRQLLEVKTLKVEVQAQQLELEKEGFKGPVICRSK